MIMKQFTFRKAIADKFPDNYLKHVFMRVPEGYCIRDAIYEGFITSEEGHALAVFISVNWKDLYND